MLIDNCNKKEKMDTEKEICCLWDSHNISYHRALYEGMKSIVVFVQKLFLFSTGL
jgi:hypothetical protein